MPFLSEEGICTPGYNSMQSFENQTTFRRNMSRPSSESKQNQPEAGSKQCSACYCLLALWIPVDFQRTIQLYVSENITLHIQRCKNFKSCFLFGRCSVGNSAEDSATLIEAYIVSLSPSWRMSGWYLNPSTFPQFISRSFAQHDAVYTRTAQWGRNSSCEATSATHTATWRSLHTDSAVRQELISCGWLPAQHTQTLLFTALMYPSSTTMHLIPTVSVILYQSMEQSFETYSWETAPSGI